MADILSQNEIDALLEVVETEEFEEGELKSNPNQIKKEDLLFIQRIHENLLLHVSNEISSLLASLVSVKFETIEQMAYKDFYMVLPQPLNLSVFSIKPNDESLVIEINPALCFGIYDKLLGGSGEGFELDRELSQIELNLLDKIFTILVKNIEKSWKNKMDINISKTNLKPLFDDEEPVLAVALKLSLGQLEGFINICYPLSFISSALAVG